MAHLDWITASLPFFSDYERFLQEVGIQDMSIKEVGNRGIPHYEKVFTLRNGASFAVPAFENRKQRILLEMSGEPCENNRAAGNSDVTTLYKLREHGAHFTRIDTAIDTSYPYAQPLQLYFAWFLTRKKTILRKEPRLIRTGSGETIYFGAETADRIIRVYDKAAELGLLSEALVRIELQSRSDYAPVIANDIIETGVKTAAAAHTRRVLELYEVDWWNEALEAVEIEPSVVRRKQTSGLMRWLNTTVRPAIEKVKNNTSHPDWLALQQWHNSIWPDEEE